MREPTTPGRTPLAIVLIAVHVATLFTGCAAHVTRPATVTEERFLELQVTCEDAAASGVNAGGATSAVRAGAAVGVAMAFQGAADGARWGGLSGGDAGKGAWIGAVAGVGIGMIVGLVIGTKKGIDAYREYHAGYERCMTAELQPAEPPWQETLVQPPAPEEPTP